jgi:hypothetical protein
LLSFALGISLKIHLEGQMSGVEPMVTASFKATIL